MNTPLHADTPRVRLGEDQPATGACLNRQPSLFEATSAGAGEAVDISTECLVKRRIESLEPHPALKRHSLLLPLDQQLALERIEDFSLERALLITQDNLIIDGLEFWQIAKRRGRATLLCQVCRASAEEALLRILQLRRRPQWLNGFCRVQLALDLEPWLRERALANQIAGGEGKALAKLPEAEKVNCREELAKVSGECGKNVDKVRKVLIDAVPPLIAAAQSDEVSINRAWKLSSLRPDEQQAALASGRSKKRSQRTLRELLSNLESDAVKAPLRELRPILAKMKAIPQLCPIWDKIAVLLDDIDRKIPKDLGDPSEQQS
jgi:hypothetical protein